jgi:hypothetical protein
MEPSAQELENFKVAKDLCDWAELVDDGEPDANPRLSFLKTLGATQATKVFLLAAIPEAAWNTAVEKWRIGELEPTPIQLASAGYVGIAARLAAGSAPTRAQREEQKLNEANLKEKELELELARTKASASGASSSSLNGMIKLATIIDQGSEREVTPLVESEVDAYYAVYRKRMGHDPRPEEDITLEQLSGLKALFASGSAPYVDLAIWGPFGQRTQRKLKLSGLILGTDGVLQQVQIFGPPNVESWAAGFAVFRTGCIMLEEVSLSTLALWSTMIAEYSSRYGNAIWALLYQTEVRARSELLTRTKRAGAAARLQATAAGGTHPFVPEKPWDWVFREAAADGQFWRKELEEKALCVPICNVTVVFSTI